LTVAEPDWDAVGKAIRNRMIQLGLLQEEVARRSNIAPATIREIEYNTVQRRRGKRTLRALSAALDWHEDHLEAIKNGEVPPERGPLGRGGQGAGGATTALEHTLRELVGRVTEIEKMIRDLHRAKFGE
jgi:transcriptional regulator with XRE-family HTH domain